MLKLITYFLLFIFFIWLTLATRHHADWFHPFIAKYDGDTIWAGDFLLLLRIFFTKVRLWKLALCNYIFGALDEVSQLWHTPLLDAIRKTTIGKLMLGLGFMWSDLLCYAAGTLLAMGLIVLMERYIFKTKKVTHFTG